MVENLKIETVNAALLYDKCGRKGTYVTGIFTDWSDEQWKMFLEEIASLKLYHILYYEDADKLYTKGINVYAIDMMSAVERFESQTGQEAHICFKK